VKLNGQRIETGEIEQVMRNAEGVMDALVMVAETKGGSKQLVGYVIPDSARVDIVTDACRQALPGYMVPAAIIPLAEWPLNQNQKVDRKQVAAMGEKKREQMNVNMKRSSSARQPQNFAKPTTELEIQIAEVWERVLGVDKIGITDNFFSLGGSSIAAVRMIGEVENLTGENLQLNDVFQNPTVQKLAAKLDHGRVKGSQSSSVGLEQQGDFERIILLNESLLTPASKTRPALFICPAAGGLAFPFFTLATAFGGDIAMYCMQDPALDKNIPFAKSAEELAVTMIESIKSIQATGPYLIAGWSFGAVLAVEVAQQLKAAGDEVPVVYCIDGYAPREEADLKAAKEDMKKQLGPGQGWVDGFYAQGGALSHIVKPFVSEHLKARVKENNNKKLVTGFNRMMAILDNHVELEANYKPRQYDGRVINFRPTGDQPWDQAILDDKLWADQIYHNTPRGRVSSYQIVEVEGDHQSMMRPPCVDLLADRFKAMLGLKTGLSEYAPYINDLQGKGVLRLNEPSVTDFFEEVSATITNMPPTKKAFEPAGFLSPNKKLCNYVPMAIDIGVKWLDGEVDEIAGRGSHSSGRTSDYQRGPSFNELTNKTEIQVMRSFDDIMFLDKYLKSKDPANQLPKLVPKVVTKSNNDQQSLRKRIQELNEWMEYCLQHYVRADEKNMPEVRSFFCLNRVHL